MLIENKVLDKKQWLNKFNKKFKNFCSKLPFYCEYNLIDNRILMTIYLVGDENDKKDIMEFELKLSYSPEMNIKEIKDNLIIRDYYPLFIEEKRELTKLTSEEIKELVDSGKYTLEESLSRKKEKVMTTTYRVEKIHDWENNVSLRCLKDNRIYLYRMKIPVSNFTKVLNNDSIRDAEEFFFKNSELIDVK